MSFNTCANFLLLSTINNQPCLFSVPRDAAAWAAESGKLYVMGGSLGTLSGYTASTEVYNPDSDQWTVGVSLTSTRASHCAVGDGEGHLVVTGRDENGIFGEGKVDQKLI